MRWTPKAALRDGDRRARQRFAWLPTLVDDDRAWIWFESYVEHSRYDIVCSMSLGCIAGWHVERRVSA